MMSAIKNMKLEIINEQAHRYIKEFYGKEAVFRVGQIDAIQKALSNNKTLVIQPTAWGKSLVYFICSKILRENDYGITIVVSPLISLINNQYKLAKEKGLNCEKLHGRVNRKNVVSLIKSNKIDILFTTPETLLSNDIKVEIPFINIGLLVIDEVHCVSQWGHDFRPSFMEIKSIFESYDKTIPLLATTATANKRVVDDIHLQFGSDFVESRGSVIRNNLYIEVLKFDSLSSKFAWILENIQDMEGTGIIYCRQRDLCNMCSDFLNENGINAKAYHSGEIDYINEQSEQLFYENKIKALVATNKLGMGYDKKDISFVIHLDPPLNIIDYYQQIGRAGRNIEMAYTYVMHDVCDFRSVQLLYSKIPQKEKVLSIFNYIKKGKSHGVAINEVHISCKTNIDDPNLCYLIEQGYVSKNIFVYKCLVACLEFDELKYQDYKKVRKEEYYAMKNMLEYGGCYNSYLAKQLQDTTSENCGVCANCVPQGKKTSYIKNKYLCVKAKTYIEKSKQAISDMDVAFISLSDKGEYHKEIINVFMKRDNTLEDIVKISHDAIKSIIYEKKIKCIATIPCAKESKIKMLAKRLANELKINYQDIFQINNLKKYAITENAHIQRNILLLGYDTKSKNKLYTLCNLLKQHGGYNVVIFVLRNDI